uniref:Carboxypeptidase n=1 Tax=Timema californicum TaxID=61474 RepID=A0A7R9J7B9_TIMCA|nr:unnamed protein product [Timema californicum]
MKPNLDVVQYHRLGGVVGATVVYGVLTTWSNALLSAMNYHADDAEIEVRISLGVTGALASINFIARSCAFQLRSASRIGGGTVSVSFDHQIARRLSLGEERFLFRDSIRGHLSKKEHPNREAYAPTRTDVGEVLLLTPYLEEGRVEEARNLSRVNLEPYSDIASYSGFFTVNKQFNSNLFFWFFPAEMNYEEAPVVLYLEGGPGESSLVGCFAMLGPFWVSSDENNLVPRNYSWHKNHSLIFIDNPVGTGFSYTENDAGYASNQTQVGNELYSAMSQFFTLFSELQKRDFFISGESYAGKR